MVSALKLPVPALATTASSDPHVLTFDEKRHFFQERLSPREEADLAEQFSARSYSSQKASKVPEFLLSPRAIPEDSDATLPTQPFAEPSPRYCECESKGVEPEMTRPRESGAAAIVAEPKVSDRLAVIMKLAENQGELARAHSVLVAMLQDALPQAAALPEAPLSIAEMTAAESHVHQLPRKRRWRQRQSYDDVAAASLTRDAVQEVRLRAKKHETMLASRCSAERLVHRSVGARADLRTNWVDYEADEFPSPARFAAAGAAVLVATLVLACVLSL